MWWRRGRLDPRMVGVLALFLVAPLAGCLGEDGTRRDPQPLPPFQPALEDPAPLPDVRLQPEMTRHRLRLTVTLEGDPSAIQGWGIDFGDGERRIRKGLPPATIEYDYQPLRNQHAQPVERTLTLSLYSHAGRQADEVANVTVLPPANRPPEATLDATTTRGATPILVTFTIGMRDTDGEVTGWQLDFGDGSTPVRGTSPPTHTIRHEYRRIGAHNATLLVHDDTDGTRTANITIKASPPEARVWTYDTQARNITLYGATGNIIATHNTTPEACPTFGCGWPVDVTATSDEAQVLVARAGYNATVWRFDAATGRSLGNVTVGIGATRMLADAHDDVWVLHEDGTVARIRAGEVARVPTLLRSSDGVLFADAAGRSLFVAAPGETGRIVRIDTATLTVDLLPFVVPDLRHAAYEDRQGNLVGIDGRGRAFVATQSVWGPVLRGAVDTGAPAAAALACRGGSGLCLAVHAGTDESPPRLVAFSSDPNAEDIALHEASATALPGGVEPVDIVPLHDATVVAVEGDASGFVVVGQETRITTPYAGSAPTEMTPHALQPRLVYHLDPQGRWAVLDAEHGEVAFRATTSLAGADGLALAYPPRSLR